MSGMPSADYDAPECCASGRCEVCTPGYEWGGGYVLPPEGCGAADQHEVMRTREHLSVCPVCNLDLTNPLPPAVGDDA